MTADAAPARRSKRWRVATITVVVAVLVAVLGPFVWRKVQDLIDGPDASAPSCSWSAHIEHANSDQAGLIRCYLRAIAHRSTSELRSVVRSADNDGPAGFAAPDFAHAADARSGTATVTVVPNDVDSADATVAIRYADGAGEDREIHVANPNSSHSWRFWDIGTYPNDPNAPPTAAP